MSGCPRVVSIARGMHLPPPNDPVVQEARRTFAAFCGSATVADAMLMDALVHAWTAVTQGMTTPREGVSAEHRAELERVVDFTERTFMKARDRVRECSSFRQLVPGIKSGSRQSYLNCIRLRSSGARAPAGL